MACGIAIFLAVFGGSAWWQCAGGGCRCVAGLWRLLWLGGVSLCDHMWTHIWTHRVGIPQPDKCQGRRHRFPSARCTAAQKNPRPPVKRRTVRKLYRGLGASVSPTWGPLCPCPSSRWPSPSVAISWLEHLSDTCLLVDSRSKVVRSSGVVAARLGEGVCQLRQ